MIFNNSHAFWYDSVAFSMKSWVATEKLSITSQSPSEATIRTSTAAAKTKAKKRKIWQKGSKRYDEKTWTVSNWNQMTFSITSVYCKINFFVMMTPRHWLSELTSPMMALSSSPSNARCRSGSGGKRMHKMQCGQLQLVRQCICWCRFCGFHLLSPFPFLDFTRTSASELKPCECACRSPRDRDMLMDGQAWAATSESTTMAQWPMLDAS